MPAASVRSLGYLHPELFPGPHLGLVRQQPRPLVLRLYLDLPTPSSFPLFYNATAGVRAAFLSPFLLGLAAEPLFGAGRFPSLTFPSIELFVFFSTFLLAFFTVRVCDELLEGAPSSVCPSLSQNPVVGSRYLPLCPESQDGRFS